LRSLLLEVGISVGELVRKEGALDNRPLDASEEASRPLLLPLLSPVVRTDAAMSGATRRVG